MGEVYTHAAAPGCLSCQVFEDQIQQAKAWHVITEGLSMVDAAALEVRVREAAAATGGAGGGPLVPCCLASYGPGGQLDGTYDDNEPPPGPISESPAVIATAIAYRAALDQVGSIPALSRVSAVLALALGSVPSLWRVQHWGWAEVVGRVDHPLEVVLVLVTFMSAATTNLAAATAAILNQRKPLRMSNV